MKKIPILMAVVVLATVLATQLTQLSKPHVPKTEFVVVTSTQFVTVTHTAPVTYVTVVPVTYTVTQTATYTETYTTTQTVTETVEKWQPFSPQVSAEVKRRALELRTSDIEMKIHEVVKKSFPNLVWDWKLAEIARNYSKSLGDDVSDVQKYCGRFFKYTQFTTIIKRIRYDINYQIDYVEFYTLDELVEKLRVQSRELLYGNYSRHGVGVHVDDLGRISVVHLFC